MLRPSALKPRKQNAPRPAWKVAEAFKQWLRGRPCVIGGQCAGRIEACHVDYAGGKGIGSKVADKFCVPMCSAHHGESHQAGIRTFEKRHSVNLLKLSEAYWKAWPGRAKWESDHVQG